MFCRSALLTALVIATCTVSSAATIDSRQADCFPVERLPLELQPLAQELALKMLDSEALYTVIGGLKPMSGGFWSTRFKLDQPNLTELSRVRQVLATFRSGDDYFADILVFNRVFDGQRFAEAIIVHRPTLAAKIREHEAFFAKLGMTPETHPLAVAMGVETAPDLERFRGLGYLYGYPNYAVDFFVQAAAEQKETKKLVPRDFVSIPTVQGANQFVWAVPKGHKSRPEDEIIRQKAALIFAEYLVRRNAAIGPDRPGAMSLLRDWLAPESEPVVNFPQEAFSSPLATPCPRWRPFQRLRR